MGNCSHKGFTIEHPNSIQILTDSGRIMEFEGPKLVEDLVANFHGYGIFQKGNASSPLSTHQRLLGGQFYYLLPLGKAQMFCNTKISEELQNIEATKEQNVQGRLSSSGAASDLVANVTKGSALEVLPSLGKGTWRVKLVIKTKQLEEILAEEVNTEALVEKMRMVASTARLTSKRTKSSWGVSWKPTFSNVFKVPSDQK